MVEHLADLATILRRLLARELPSTGPDWWETGVRLRLTYQQQLMADEHGWTSLQDLDTAAVLRVVDQNWDLLRRRNLVKWDDRTLLKEASSIRNRYAHDAPGRSASAERRYRDLDTLVLLAEAIEIDSTEAEGLRAARSSALLSLSPPRDASKGEASGEANSSSSTVLAPGLMIRVKARPDLTGVITGVDSVGTQIRLTVFHGSMSQTYFDSQVEPLPTRTGEHVHADILKARIVASHVLHPSISRLYSLNTGRIEYEPYQYRPVIKLIHADRPRLLVADDVGVGKTIEAGLILKELEARQRVDSVLVVCPKPLVVEGKWRAEMRRFGEDFAHLDSTTLRHCIEEVRAEGIWPSRYRKAILPYSLLDEKLLMGESGDRNRRIGLLSLIPPLKFDLIIVDEAHHVRNSDTWSHRVVKYLMDSAEAAILISATPIQTGNEDLRTLLRLLRPDIFADSQAFDLMREPNAFLAEAESAARSANEGWQSQALLCMGLALGTAWGRNVLVADPRMQEVQDLLRVVDPSDNQRVRTLRLIQSLNSFSSLISRTRRRDIGSFTTRKPETFEIDFSDDQRAVYQDLLSLAADITRQQGHGQSMNFMLSTLQRQAASCLNGLAPFIEDILQRRLSAEDLSEADVDIENFDTAVMGDFTNQMRRIAERALALRDDPKLDRLFSYVHEKQSLDNNKLLVFSTFRHTLTYLAGHLSDTGVRVGLMHGATPDEDRRELRARFARERDDPTAIDLLLSSEIGTEGLDYQFCDTIVNYDLPWNPMRIEQRIGRIDRRGQRSETIAIKNLIVSGTVDAAIYQRCLVRIGVFERALGGSEAILGDLTREIRKIGEDLTLTEEERSARLRQLADNRLGRIQEQEELEDRESALFGLTLKKLDVEGVEQNTSPWLAASQLGHLVQQFLKSVGYERSETLFSRPMAVFRPSKQVRQALRDSLPIDNPQGSSTFLRWLSQDSDQTIRLTFDPALATEKDVELLSPIHDLVRISASQQEEFVSQSTTALRATSQDVPSGIYPFALYAWTYLGSRDDFEVALITLDEQHSDALARLLIVSQDAPIDPSAAKATELEDAHFLAWSLARTAHIERTRVHLTRQLGSLTTSHQARVMLLEDQIAEASHEKIRRMREAELLAAQSEFERRKAKLEESLDRTDLIATPLCTGTLEVTHE